jgi:hypothetical protein
MEEGLSTARLQLKKHEPAPWHITASLPPPQLKLLGMLGAKTALRLVATPDMAFAIEASSNVLHWLPLRTNIATGGTFDYVDDGTVGLSRRFYRARWVP